MLRIVKLIALIAVYQFVLPYAFGSLVCKLGKRKMGIRFRFLMGYMMQLGMFAITAFINVGAGASLSKLEGDWMTVSTLLLVISFVYLSVDIWRFMKAGVKSIRVKPIRRMRMLGVGVLFFVALIVAVFALRAFTIPSAMDDTIEVARTNVKYADEKLYLHNEFTGELRENALYELPESADHPIALYYAVYAHMADISANRTVLYLFSVMLLFLAVLSFMELGKRIFPERAGWRAIWLSVVCLVYVRMLFSGSFVGMQLLSTTWNGTAVYVGVFVPFVFSVIADLFGKKWTVGDVLAVFGLLCCGNLLIAGGGFPLLVMLLTCGAAAVGKRGARHD